MSRSRPVGAFCLVLHSHLPWLAHAGDWPVGEEWLHQAWSGSYLPVVELLREFADRGRRELLTLGVTPVLAAQLDDPYCLRQFHTWLGTWQVRAAGLAGRPEQHLRALAGYEHRRAGRAIDVFERRWRHGTAPVLRELAEAGVVELLGGPATHPFLPTLPPAVAEFALALGRDDAALRFGRRPAGLWAPECGYRAGLELMYARQGVTHFVVDGPAMHGRTGLARPVGDTQVLAFGRDLGVTYRVWSPRSGYPAGRHYRDFHSFDHPSGFRAARVTSVRTPPERKAPWRPEAAAAAVATDVADFVRVVRERLAELRARLGRPGVVVAAYDTELFGHWWHEGVGWLAGILAELPRAGVQVTTLAGARAAGLVGPPTELPDSSWGWGKDWRVWVGPAVTDLAADQATACARLTRIVGKQPAHTAQRRTDLDQLAREALLAASSDWAFSISRNSAADYARRRATQHLDRFRQLADRIESGRPADLLAARLRQVDGPFGHLDARDLGRVVATLAG